MQQTKQSQVYRSGLPRHQTNLVATARHRLVLCLVLTFTNLQSYLNLAHRDMGILRRQGYSGRRVARIYRIRLRAVVTRASLAPLVLAVVLGASVLRAHARDAAIDVFVVVAVLGLVFAAMALV